MSGAAASSVGAPLVRFAGCVQPHFCEGVSEHISGVPASLTVILGVLEYMLESRGIDGFARRVRLKISKPPPITVARVQRAHNTHEYWCSDPAEGWVLGAPAPSQGWVLVGAECSSTQPRLGAGCSGT